MKKVLTAGIIILIVGLTVFLLIGIADKIQKSKIAKEGIKSLPVFSFRTLNDSIFNSDQLKEGPVLILFFHPECEHCQYQISTLFKNNLMPPGLKVLLISNAEKEGIRRFMEENDLLQHPGLIALADQTYSFRDYFGTEIVPALFIYNKELKLIRYFQGEVKPETILEYLKQDD
jgi:thiol-disulfide isomerase/thioredoxin